MESDRNGLVRLVGAIGAELLRLGLDLSEFQNELARTGWHGPAAGAGETLPQALASADADRIVALQDLDRLTQTAAALGSLSARVAAYLHDPQHGNRAGEDLSAALRLVPLVSLRDRLASSLHSDRAVHGGNAAAGSDRVPSTNPWQS